MIYKIWKHEQIDCLQNTFISLESQTEFCNTDCIQKVIKTLQEYVKILADNYGADRNPDSSLGGWIAVFLDENFNTIQYEYKEFLDEHFLNPKLAEVQEIIVDCGNNIHWLLEIYIVSSDFSYILVFPKKSS